MLYLSGCSGIEAATVAWHPLGWKAKAFAEIEKFPSAVLAHHYPDVPNLGDFTKIDPDEHLDVEVFVAGTPCQSFSVAGLRGGIKDKRGNLTLHFVRIAHALATRGSLRYAIWENVPGVLSMPDNSFGCLLGGLVGADAPLRSPLERGRWPDAGMVAGPRARLAWRVLNAQHFGLAQRRQRVFVVAGFGEGTDPAQILFERKGVRRHPPKSKEARKNVAGTLGSRSTAGGGLGTDFELDGGLIETAALNGIGEYGRDKPTLRAQGGDCGGGSEALLAFGGNNSSGEIDIATALTAHGSARLDFETETFVTHALTAEGFDASEDGTGRGTPLIPIPLMAAGCHGSNGAGIGMPGDPAFTVDTTGAQAIAFSCKDHGADAGGDKAHALQGMTVRRLTPTECHRLQGFPDEYARIPWRGKPAEECPDGPIYRGLGNSMAIPPMRWIGHRIDAAEKARKEKAA